ncbi:MAG: hypothetical protein JSR65_03480 [Proteobacteria bacterium]|nr:hypothetical protein [Pseudomonadota bacterium]
MNAMTVWKTTTATIDSGQRAFMGGVLAIVSIATLSLLHYETSAASAAVFVFGFGLVFWWAFVVGRALLLQRDARLLRVPGVDRTVALNLAMQFVALVVLPATVIAALSGLRFAAVSGVLACLAIGGIVWQVLPRWASIFIVFLPSLMQSKPIRDVLPGWNDPGFAGFVWVLACVLVTLAGWRWRALLVADADGFGQWNMPMVIQMQRQVGIGGGYRNFDVNALYAAAKRTGLDRQVQLRGAGPGQPVAALRVWLGAAFAPQSLRARLSQNLYVLLPMLIVGVFMRLSLSGWRPALNWTAMMMSLFVPAMCAGIVPARLGRLYRNAGSEIALLATLPGLGGGALAKRSLLQASAGWMSRIMLAFAVCDGAVLLLGGNRPTSLLVVALPTLAAIAMNFALAYNVIGGLRISPTVIVALCVLGLTAICLTPSLAFLQTQPGSLASWDFAGVVAGNWLLVFVLLTWLGWRGRAAYRLRPHPFLLNS